MRNILVGDDSQLHLIDWALSGFYPPWFEYVNWRYWLDEGFGGRVSEFERTNWFWNLLIPFIAHGPYFKQKRWFYRCVHPVINYAN